MIGGLSYGDSRRTSNVRDLATQVDVLTLYSAEILTRSPDRYRAWVEKVAAQARKANPEIIIEVAITTGANDAGTQLMYNTIAELIHVADRVGIYCELSKPSLESLVMLIEGLRAQIE